MGGLYAEGDGELLATHVARRIGDVSGIEQRVAGIAVEHVLGVAIALLGNHYHLEARLIVLAEELRQVAFQHLCLLLLNGDEEGEGLRC